MELEKTPIWADVKKVLNDGPKPIRYEYVAKLHTEVNDINLMKVVMVDIVRDFVNNIGDTIFIEVMIPLGDYVKDLYPYRTNLELTLIRKQLFEVGDIVPKDAVIEQERYKAVFLPGENVHPNASDYAQIDRQSLNLMDIRHVKFQLMNRSLEPIRIKTTGGIFKNSRNEDVIRSVIMNESNKILLDGKPCCDGIQMVPSDNQEVKRHVVIPQGTLIPGLPTFCHEKMNGVYTAGIGTYFQTYNQKRLWFVYPLFNTQRFNENVNKAVFFAVPTHRFTAIERTYRKQGTVVYILTTSTKVYKDHAETEYMDKGVGFRMTDARPMMKKPVKITTDGPVGMRGNLNNEVSIKSRVDDLNFAPVAETTISSNPFAQYSRILQRNGGRLDLVWENADIREIYPGMPCKYVFMVDNVLKEVKGVVLFCHGVAQMENKGVSDNVHRMHCQITLFVEQIDN